MQQYTITIRHKTFTLMGSFEQIIFVSLLSLTGLFAILYSSFLGITISNIMERKSVESSNVKLTTAVSELELAYLNESNKIDFNLAKERGFKDASEVAFVSRARSGDGTLSLAKTN